MDTAPGIRNGAAAKVAPKATAPPIVSRKDFLPKARHLMNEEMVPRRLSRNGLVSRETATAITRMDCGPDITRMWTRLDECVTMLAENDKKRLVIEANDLANRLLSAQTGLAEAVFRSKLFETAARN